MFWRRLPLVNVEPRDLKLLAPSFGPAPASGLTEPSTGRFCLWETLAFGIAKMPISVTSSFHKG